MKVIACEDCEAEFHIKYDMDENLYKVLYCPFCGEELSDDDEFEDDIDWTEEFENE